MDHSVNILNELRAISPEVAAISRQLPYQAPAGYFENLPLQLLQLAREEEPLSTVLPKAVVNPYSVPAGYFDQLADTILLRAKAAEEALTAQEELSVLSPLLSRLDKKLPFEAPAGYFAELTDNVVSGAKAIDFVNEELENLSPVMAGLKDKQVYEAPVGYFEALPGQLLSRVKKDAEPAKVVALGFRRKVMRYAAAAALIGAVVTAAWWFTGKPGASGPDIVVAKVDKLSVTELQDYLEDEPVVMSADLLAINSRPELEANDMGDLLQNVSDDEIQKYLEQNMLTKNTGTN
ncbi:hypothetical protein D3H65_26175 [Paraflavitalea soli]|uniref:Uncharacterized protein n=1 Tax=Paraflavitalea soli TaxID=2315862 RepID=A0A3B7MW79_9BACT|nr:hypothetical protein [Paraflavitalea soli]AXY77256.1 hypothetical protein D3H65_26175 [Paraflavitalea soli]